MRFHPWLLIPIVLYVGFVGFVTLGPQAYGEGGSSLLWRALGLFGRHESTQWLTFSRVEGLANIGMFVPLGFLVAAFLPRPLWLVAIALCILASIGIETYQGAYLSTRVEDYRDVIHNGTGAAIGAVVVTLGRMVVAPRRRRSLRAA